MKVLIDKIKLKKKCLFETWVEKKLIMCNVGFIQHMYKSIERK